MFQGASCSLLTETKSGPKNTDLTPSMLNRFVANGDGRAEVAVRNSCVEEETLWPGRNFKASGLGVDSV